MKVACMENSLLNFHSMSKSNVPPPVDLIQVLEQWSEWQKGKTAISDENYDMVVAIDQLILRNRDMIKIIKYSQDELEKQNDVLTVIARISKSGPYTKERFEAVNELAQKTLGQTIDVSHH